MWLRRSCDLRLAHRESCRHARKCVRWDATRGLDDQAVLAMVLHHPWSVRFCLSCAGDMEAARVDADATGSVNPTGRLTG